MEYPCSGDDDRVHNRLGSMALVDLQSRISGFGQPIKLSYVILYKGGQKEKNMSTCVSQMKNLVFGWRVNPKVGD